MKTENFNFYNTYKIDKNIVMRKPDYGHQSKYYKSKRGTLNVNITYFNDTDFVPSVRGLDCKLNLHYEDAINGMVHKLLLPDGKVYDVKIPAKTKDGDVFRLQNLGGFAFDGKTRTDLYVTVNIIIDYDRVKTKAHNK